MESREPLAKKITKTVRFTFGTRPSSPEPSTEPEPSANDNGIDYGTAYIAANAVTPVDLDTDVATTERNIIGNTSSGDSVYSFAILSKLVSEDLTSGVDSSANSAMGNLCSKADATSPDDDSEMPDLVDDHYSDTAERTPRPWYQRQHLNEEESVQAALILETEALIPFLERLKGTTHDKMPPAHRNVKAKSYTQVVKERLLPIGDFVKGQTKDLENRSQMEMLLWRYIGEKYWPVVEHEWPHLRAHEMYYNSLWKKQQLALRSESVAVDPSRMLSGPDATDNNSDTTHSPPPFNDRTFGPALSTCNAQPATEPSPTVKPLIANDLPPETGNPRLRSHTAPNSAPLFAYPLSPSPPSTSSTLSSSVSIRSCSPVTTTLVLHEELFPNLSTILETFPQESTTSPSSPTATLQTLTTIVQRFIQQPGSPKRQRLNAVTTLSPAYHSGSQDSFSHSHSHSRSGDVDAEKEKEQEELLAFCQALCVSRDLSPELAEQMVDVVGSEVILVSEGWDSEKGVRVLEKVLERLVGDPGNRNGGMKGGGDEMEGMLGVAGWDRDRPRREGDVESHERFALEGFGRVGVGRDDENGGDDGNGNGDGDGDSGYGEND